MQDVQHPLLLNAPSFDGQSVSEFYDAAETLISSQETSDVSMCVRACMCAGTLTETIKKVVEVIQWERTLQIERFGKDGMRVLVNEVGRKVTEVVYGEHNALSPEFCFDLY